MSRPDTRRLRALAAQGDRAAALALGREAARRGDPDEALAARVQALGPLARRGPAWIEAGDPHQLRVCYPIQDSVPRASRASLRSFCEELLAVPELGAVRSLTLGVYPEPHGDRQRRLQRVIDLLGAHAGRLTSLRGLWLGHPHHEQILRATDGAMRPVHALLDPQGRERRVDNERPRLRGLGAVLKQLEWLVIDASGADLGGVRRLPALRHLLIWERGALSTRLVRQVARLEAPALERLALVGGSASGFGALASARWPALRALHLHRACSGAPLSALLAAHPRLEVLDLRRGDLDDRDAQALSTLPEGLRCLDLRCGFLGPEGAARLRALAAARDDLELRLDTRRVDAARLAASRAAPNADRRA